MGNAAQMNALVGSVLDDRYEVGAPLGAGAMGYVYRGRQRALDRPVAIKVLSERHAQDPELVGRFKREARAASAIGHPGIVQVFDFGTLPDGRAYLVMELVEGRSLGSIMSEEGPLDPARAIAIAIRIAQVLTAAHERGIVHRDLKPDNLLLTRGDEIKLIDFGIAKLLDVSLVLTKTNTMVGTPLYMAPEQWQGEEVDGRTDLYALGGILFEMIAGRPPFETDHLHTIITKHLTEVPPTLASLVPSVSGDVSELVASCLAKERGDRPASARALAEALERAMSRAVGFAPTQATPQPFAAHPAPSAGGVEAPAQHAAAAADAHAAPEPSRPLARTELYQGRRVAAPTQPRRSLLPIFLAFGGLTALVLSAGVVYLGLMFFSGSEREPGVAAAPPSEPSPLTPIADGPPEGEGASVANEGDDSDQEGGETTSADAEEASDAEDEEAEHAAVPAGREAPRESPRPRTPSTEETAMSASSGTCLIESDPTGARVVDMVEVGRTPLRLEVDEPRIVVVAKQGYEPEHVNVVPGGRVRVTLHRADRPAPPPPEPDHSSRTRGWDD